MTLLQLNRHLDDTHAEVEPLEKDDITSWFRKRMLKAKTFQPVAVLNQKLKGLDVFEANDLPPPPSSSVTVSSSSPAPERDADFYVTRAHWQKSYGDDYCLDPSCRRPLGVVNGCVNCRKCGRLFCEEHTMYQIKLSRSAQHEPVRGYWSRVCETCYVSREGYNDHNGIVQDHSESFRAIRKRKVERACLEVTRLEKRLTKLTQLLTAPPSNGVANGEKAGLIKFPKPLASQRRALEQSVVAWEDDNAVTNCPYCEQTFSLFSQPKHHCRLCGKVVCGDPRTGCSKEIHLNVSPPLASEKLVGAGQDDLTLAVRICAPCQSTLFSKREFLQSLHSQPPTYVRAYITIVSFQTGIREQLPRFQRTVEGLQRRPDDRNAVVEAMRMKKRIVESLAKVDAVAKQIAGGKGGAGTGAEERLRKAVALATANWGQEVGMRVKGASTVLDRIVETARPTAAAEIAARLGKPAKVLPPTPKSKASVKVTVNGADWEGEDEMETEAERQRRETVVVLEEQKFLVLGMLEDAKKRRRFDEVEALGRSLEEIEDEIHKLGGGVVGV
ncbi:hypothetical protein FN846DRAFT_900073 [Sphaerosporella brunnea]|uniref:FYVE-type domain-containing protein n=1 Tax=Sphaerosporella brunnea TaxID=1250544 RepID=A0A5J5EPL8_9PEZI|nr:hypothetical protein FN846DRAFT_900073 [Sphaerosporella brunnea]